MTAKSKIRGAYLVALAVWLICLIAMLNGCARFTTTQTDTRDDKNKLTTIRTKATAYTFFAAKSALANWKATQTEKSQGASVGSLAQESDAGTNLTQLAESVARGVAAGLKPKP